MVTRKMTDEKSREYWESLERLQKQVEAMPAWLKESELIEMTLLAGDEIWVGDEMVYRHAGIEPLTIKVPRSARDVTYIGSQSPHTVQ